jgi:nitrate reductase gamma subunit
MELSGAVLLIGLTLGLGHRLVNVKAEKPFVDVKLLWLLWLVTATGFLAEAVRLAGEPNDPLIAYSFLMQPVAAWMRESYTWNWKLQADWVWCLHATFAAGFFAYIPFSKFVHILSAPLGRSITQNGDYAHQKRQRISEGLL